MTCARRRNERWLHRRCVGTLLAGCSIVEGYERPHENRVIGHLFADGIYIGGGVLVVILIILVVLLLMRRGV